MQKLLNLMNMMEMYQNISEYKGSDPSEMLKNILTPEQQSMFDMYNTMFSSEEGGNTNA